MNNKSLSTLEYNKIISRLVSFACSDGAKQILHKLEPMTDIDKINTALVILMMHLHVYTRREAWISQG